MGQDTRQDRKDRLKGRGIEGSMSRSDSENARARRGAQRELDFSTRFDPAFFELDSDGRVTLKLSKNPTLGVDLIQWHRGEQNSGIGSPYRDIGYTYGPSLEDSTDEAHAHWPIPLDCDRSQKVLLEVYIAQRGANAGTYTLTLEIYSFVPTDNVVTDDGSPEATLTTSLVTITTDGAPHTATFTLEPGKILRPAAEAVIFRLIATTHPTATDLVLHISRVSYTPRFYHTHE